jgi:hypothetical protein
MDRYSTIVEARDGHWRTVAAVRRAYSLVGRAQRFARWIVGLPDCVREFAAHWRRR